jgi:hypothetical protein
MENLVVFSVLANAPWKRVASFEVPADLPPCPAGGCICVHVWVPGICGERASPVQSLKGCAHRYLAQPTSISTRIDAKSLVGHRPRSWLLLNLQPIAVATRIACKAQSRSLSTINSKVTTLATFYPQTSRVTIKTMGFDLAPKRTSSKKVRLTLLCLLRRRSFLRHTLLFLQQ